MRGKRAEREQDGGGLCRAGVADARARGPEQTLQYLFDLACATCDRNRTADHK